MSFVISLYGPSTLKHCKCPDCGNEHEGKTRDCLCSCDIPSALQSMATEAGIYACLWRPYEHGIMKAVQLIPLLKKGLERLLEDPNRFKQLEILPFYTYANLVAFVSLWLVACANYPDADVVAAR